MLPSAKTGLVCQDFGAEFLVYDSATEKAHYLSPVGAQVLLACQADKDQSELAETLTKEFSVADAQAVIEETLKQLADEGMLAGEVEASGFDRRRFLAAAGKVAALPVVLSVLAPKPAMAQSCRNCATIGLFGPPADCVDCGRPCPDNAGCSTSARCCFEYTLNPANGGAGTACVPAELSGAFFCRIPSAGGGFACDCSTSRDNAIGVSNTIGTLYYCCICPGSAPNQCATCTP